jgi:signal peptidase I
MKIRRFTDTGEWTTRRYLSLLGTVLIWAIVAIDAWFLWPTQLGGDTSIVVVSGESMEPTYFGGDLVIARTMEPSVGDVIVYAPEGLGGAQIVHRIIGGSADEGWRMQGDNNDFVDPFTPQAGEVKGVVLVHYANFGRVTVLLLNPLVWAFVLLAAMVLMLWYTGDDCDHEDHDKNEGKDKGAPETEAEEELDLIDRVVEGTEAAVARMVDASAAAAATAFASLTRRSPAPRHAAPVHHSVFSVPLRTSAILAVVGLVAVVGPTMASASQLTVNIAGQSSVMTYTKCDNLTLTAVAAGPRTGNNSNQYSEVTISGISAECTDLPITVNLHKNNGGIVAAGTGVSSSPSTTLTVSPSNGNQWYNANQVRDVVVSIDGWLFVAEWSQGSMPPDPSVGACEGYLLSNGEIPSGTVCNLTTSAGGRQFVDRFNGGPGYYRAIQLATAFTPESYFDDGRYVAEYQGITRWRATLNLTVAPYGSGLDLAGGFYLYNENNTALAPGEDCSDPTSITFEERTVGSNPGTGFTLSDSPINWAASNLLCSGP